MCDDYDTDFDSEPDEFNHSNLIDDIQRINLALAADSDEPSDEDDEAEEEGEFKRIYKLSRTFPVIKTLTNAYL